jgi:hypothetical protein
VIGRAMKRVLTVSIFCLLAVAAVAQDPPTPTKHHRKGANGTNAPGQPGEPPPDPAADQAKLVEGYRKSFVPTDPWRIMNDKTNYAKGKDWVQFEGVVKSANANGLVLQGWYGEPLCYLLPNNGGATETTFLLSNFPRHVGLGQLFSRNARLVAFKSDDKNGMTTLEYGTVWVPELTEEQKAQIASAKTKKDSSVLAWHKELAEKGDAYGEYKMGMRYLNGDGVDKDLSKAHDLLAKSSAQGNTDATDALAKLPPAN